ncbi:uncharacterized protein N7529_011587 [Penicillium soppii]|uniref:uncharacterized protein n=1 Tax=Penicillium soppii TaxID=69789 RepID=UPI002546B470|nr:uncharacterized protein N7529_011587 [Penicillium soppii]KAJ5852202.1 hypothetical protein N7529_011587 [Penicillium soppii]
MEIWHKSTDTWFNSKDRCQQSAKGMLDRSVSKWNESADHIHQVIRIQTPDRDGPTRPTQMQDNGSPPSSPDSAQSPRSSTSRFYSESTGPSQTDSSPSSRAIKPTSLIGPSLSPIVQIRAFHESSVTVRSLIEATQKLRDEKKQILGEIELDWINSTIVEADHDASDLSTFMAPFWANQYNGTQIDFSNRKKWTRRDYQRALKKESRMILSHSRVKTVFSHLESLQTELQASSVGPKDEEFIAGLGISELALTTRVVSVVELPGQSPMVRDQVGSPMIIPKIVVTQHDDDLSSVYEGTPPPSYELKAHDVN